jgi:hypothetical protein
MPATVRIASGAKRNRWRLHGTVGAVSLDVYFGVPSNYKWSEHVDAGKFEDPCTNAATVMVTSDGTRGKLYGRPPIECRGPTAKAVVADLRTAFELVGPWTLVTPTETLLVQADATQGDWDQDNAGQIWRVGLGFQEVDAEDVGLAVPLPPPGGFPGPLTTGVTAGNDLVVAGAMPVFWTNLTGATGADFIGLYLPTDPITTALADARESVSTGGAISGMATMTGIDVAPGIYQLRGVYGPGPSVVIGPYITQPGA